MRRRERRQQWGPHQGGAGSLRGQEALLPVRFQTTLPETFLETSPRFRERASASAGGGRGLLALHLGSAPFLLAWPPGRCCCVFCFHTRVELPVHLLCQGCCGTQGWPRGNLKTRKRLHVCSEHGSSVAGVLLRSAVEGAGLTGPRGPPLPGRVTGRDASHPPRRPLRPVSAWG